jgi:apolipoprotein N-acyltransferase
MPDEALTPSQVRPGGAARFSEFANRFRSEVPSLSECVAALVSATLLIVSFPNFDLWPLAWIALIPLLLVLVRRPQSLRTFLLGWLFGTVFFYGSCYWLTYSMIHFGGIRPWLAFLLLLPGAVVMGIFPAIFSFMIARAIRKWGRTALFFAPLLWSALEWTRLETTGQLWNAIGYSQAYQPFLIQSARWGGIYAVGYLIVLVNSLLAYYLAKTSIPALLTSAVGLAAIFGVILVAALPAMLDQSSTLYSKPDVIVVAVQPNVPMEPMSDPKGTENLISRHISLSTTALQNWERAGEANNAAGLKDSDWAKEDSTAARRAIPRLVIWPESPMNFTYGTDSPLREKLAAFAKANNTSVLLNSQEAAPNDGIYNSALLINEQGKLVAQYDKIRLLPFGEYVPLPEWLPGAGLIRAIVGDFTPGTNYRLMPVGNLRAGVFICIESAYPSIARRLTNEGAGVLINISNDGYLGPTAVMRQHLANAVFRAVENGRPLLRVTNTGITAFITPAGKIRDATEGFKPDVRTWATRGSNGQTFYSKFGDLFPAACVVLSLLIFVLSSRKTARPLVNQPASRKV